MKRMWSAWALVAVLGGGCGKSDEAPAAPEPTAAGDKKPGKVIACWPGSAGSCGMCTR